MVIKVPHYYEFSESLQKTISEKTGCSVPEWEIAVPRQDDIAWSIVLSYLLATNYREKDDFSSRLKTLTGSDDYANLVNRSIKYFNPFRNRYACFYDEALKRVVKDFKTNLNWNILFSVFEKLSAVSEYLDCPILSIWGDPERGEYQIYMKNIKRRDSMITLKVSSNIFDDDDNSVLTQYNFMINGNLGSKMKKAALLYFLKEVKVYKKEIRMLKSIDEKDDHFLIDLLKKGCHNVILKLYKSPYIVSKISEAGYEIDPRTRDKEGFSALHHALFLGNFDVMYKLYYFAANNCSQSEGSYRNPDSSIVSNLHSMEDILSTDLSKLNDMKYHRKYNGWKKTLEELKNFNSFLLEINRKIVKIKNEVNYYESMSENVFEATKRRDIIATLLEAYIGQENKPQQNLNLLEPLKDYISHRNYYNLIDMATAIIFFDNIFLLKERLVLKNENQFSEIESSFFLSILYHIVFEKADNYISKNLPPSLKFHLRNFYIFMLIERIDNLDKIVKFNDILRSTIISGKNAVSCIPENEVKSILNIYPKFKDVIQIDRLKLYTKAALSIKITNSQSVLVIQRALQVIGEYMTPEEDDESFSKRFLSLCLPKEVSRILKRVRHELTHLKGHTFPSKFECEKNLALFRSLQKEILEIEKHFKIVYRIVDLSSGIYVAKELEKELKRMKDVGHLNAYLPLFLDEDVTDFVYNLPYVIFEKHKRSYLHLFKTVLDRSRNDINEMFNLNSESIESLTHHISYTLRALKWLLEIIQQCNVCDVETILGEYLTLEKCNSENAEMNDIKKKIDTFIKSCDGLYLQMKKKGKQIKLLPLNSPKNIEQFLKILKGFVFLSTEEKDKIRNEIPDAVRQSISLRNKLIQSVNEGFSFNIDEHPDFQIVYLSKKKMRTLQKLYRDKDSSVLTVLNEPDPIEQLEEIFSKNCAEKKKYKALCDIMQFSEETRRKLGKLVAGQRKKIPGNNLSNLLNRIQLLKRIIIEENEEVFSLWVKVKSKKSRQLISDKIVQRYLKDPQQHSAVDMLLFDCMMLFENEKGIENPWIKSSKLYTGINLRNVISHGSPLLETLCKLLDPEDLPSEKIKKMLRLIKCEDAVKAILELFERVGNDFTMLSKIIKSEEKDDYCELRDRILKCKEWKNYVLLLPHDPKNVTDNDN